MKRLLLLSLALGVASVACGTSDGDAKTADEANLEEDTDASSSEVTISFDGDFNESTDAALVVGQTLLVDYDPARLEECEAVQGGIPQWAITGWYSVNGSEAESFDVLSPNNPDAEMAEISLDEAGSLAMWFEATSTFGCHAWDSNLDQNYVFEVAAE